MIFIVVFNSPLEPVPNLIQEDQGSQLVTAPQPQSQVEPKGIQKIRHSPWYSPKVTP